MSEEIRNPLDDLGSDNPEAGTAPEGQPSPEQAPPQTGGQAPSEETKSAELILGKFKTVEDLGKSYEELERAYHGDRQTVSALNKLASQWQGPDGNPLSVENLLDLAHRAMVEQYIKSKPTGETAKPPEEETYVDPEIKKFLDPHLAEIQVLKKEIAELKAVEQTKRYADATKFVQEEAKTIMNDPELKTLALTEEEAYRCMNLAGPKETGLDVARKILKTVQKGLDKYIESKKSGQSQKREVGGSSPVIQEKETSFRPGKGQISPLKAWEDSNI